MSSKEKKAISSLNTHLSTINTVSNVQEGNNWKASLKDTLDLYIGKDSSISKRLDKLYFTRVEDYTIKGLYSPLTDYIYDESKKQNFRDLIDTAIKHVQSNGVYKNPNKKNLLSGFTNSELIGGTSFLVLLVFGIGFYFGRIEKDKESLRTEDLLKKIEVENRSLKHKIKDQSIKPESIKNDTTKR